MTWKEFKEMVDTKLAEMSAEGGEHGESEELGYIFFDRRYPEDGTMVGFSIEDNIIVLEIQNG